MSVALGWSAPIQAILLLAIRRSKTMTAEDTTTLSALFRCLATLTDLSTMLLAIALFTQTFTPRKTQPSAIWLSRIMIQLETARRSLIRPLAHRRFSPTLTAIQTTPLVFTHSVS